MFITAQSLFLHPVKNKIPHQTIFLKLTKKNAMKTGTILLYAMLFSFLSMAAKVTITSDKVIIASNSAIAQTADVWSDFSEKSFKEKGERRIVPLKYRTVKSNIEQLKNILTSAPVEFTARAKNSPVVIQLPAPDGSMQRFELTEYSMMEPGLSSQYPDFKTFSVKGIDDIYATGKLDITAAGFHGMVLTPNGDYFIDPYSSQEKEIYISYYKHDLAVRNDFECLVSENPQLDNSGNNNLLISSGPQLRTFRLAVAATGEYTVYFGGTVTLGMAAIVSAVNRVNGVYERDFTVRLTLIANNSVLVYTNSATDPYTNNNGSTMLGQNQTNITNVIGSANYDIGHVFSTGGGGVAGLSVVCNSSNKARGVTGSPTPDGDGFWIDYVAHEMGHQFGGNHSFNGNAGSCAGGNRNASTAWEPGSGSTIMGYAGICGAQDLQTNSDAYFHSGSFSEIATFTQASVCPVVTNTGNNAPSVNVPTGGFSIPISTPFSLTGSATDETPSSLTYCWEEFDVGPAGAPGSPSGNAPIFRSFNPVSTPTRTFPKLSDLLNNTSTIGEILPSYKRSLSFRLTVRDNVTGGGGVNYNTISFNVDTVGGSFRVTQPNTNVNWNSSVQQTVTWSGSTSSAPYNVSLVNILLSIDGGNTFPTTLLSNTANDGSQLVTLPAVNTTQARVKVEAVGNIFFDISNVNFQISNTNVPSISHTALTDMIKQSWPATVSSAVTSIFPLDSVWVSWYKNSPTIIKQFRLNNTSGNNYSGVFNSLNSEVAIGDLIYYRVVAQNNSASHEKDSTALISFKILDGILCESYAQATFPPSGWSIQFPTTSYWTRNVASAFGSGAGSAKFDFYNAPLDTTQSLVTFSFVSTFAGDSLKFDEAYAPYTSGIDSLQILTSSDGVNYTSLVRLYGGPSGGTLNTAAATTSAFTPTSAQWASKKYALPSGTNKIKFRARSGYGNNLYIDNICVGNSAGPVASTITAGIEGLFNVNTNKLNIRDSVRLYLRSTLAPYGIVDSAKGVLDSNTLSCNVTFVNAQSGTYYVVVKHRNSIETWSKAGGQSFSRGIPFSYDFTTSISQAYGNNMILLGSDACNFSGDVTQDYNIDISDLAQIDNAVAAFLEGYVVEDLTGDRFVDLADYAIADDNAAAFIVREAPVGAASAKLITTNLESVKQKLELMRKPGSAVDIKQTQRAVNK